VHIQSVTKPIEVLLVEDNPGDAQLTRIALSDGKMCINLSLTEDGVDALAFLRKQGKYADAPRPDLILLDLNLPRKDGREVLADVKADPGLKRIPVVVLTTSQSDTDILQAYELAANCFITKPVDFDQFVKIVQTIEDFWFTVVKLPSE
jgi:CheY-like chemotaxis protein